MSFSQEAQFTGPKGFVVNMASSSAVGWVPPSSLATRSKRFFTFFSIAVIFFLVISLSAYLESIYPNKSFNFSSTRYSKSY